MDRTALIERRFHNHLAGNWTVTPYQFADDSVVVVHTGWLPEGQPEHATNVPPDLNGVVITPKNLNLDVRARKDIEFTLSALPRLGELDAEFLYEQLGLEAPPRPDTLVVLLARGSRRSIRHHHTRISRTPTSHRPCTLATPHCGTAPRS